MKKKTFIRLSILFSIIVSLVLLLPYAKKSFFSYLQEEIKKETGYELIVKQVEFNHFSSVIFQDIELQKENDLVAKINTAELQINLYSFIKGTYIFKNIALDKLIIKKSNSSETKDAFSMPSIPNIYFVISKFKINELSIDDDLFHVKNIEGEIVNNKDSLSLSLAALNKENQNIQLNFDTKKNELLDTYSSFKYGEYEGNANVYLKKQKIEGSLHLKHLHTITLAESDFTIDLKQKKLSINKLSVLDKLMEFSGEIFEEEDRWKGHLITEKLAKVNILNEVELDLKGRLGIDASCSKNFDRLQVALNGKSVTVGHVDLGEVALKITVNSLFNNRTGKFLLDLSQIQSDNFFLDTFHFSGTYEELQKKCLIAAYAKNKDLTVNCKGNLELHSTETSLEIVKLNGQVLKNNFYTTTPFSITYKDNNIAISSMEINNSEGKVLSLTYGDKQLFAALNLQKFPVSCLSPLFGHTLEGSISANGVLKGDVERMQGTVDIYLQNFSIDREKFEIPPVDASISGKFIDKELKFAGKLDNFPLELKGTLPLKFSEETSLHIDKNKPLYVHAKSAGNIAPIFEWMAFPDLIISGMGEGEITIQGKMDALDLSGKGSVTAGSMESFALGAVFNHLEASFSLDNDRLNLTTLSANDLGFGELNGKGHIKLSLKEKFPCFFTFDMHSFQALKTDTIKGLFDGSIDISGNQDKIALRGKLNNLKSEYSIATKNDEEMEALDVIYINQSSHEPLPTIIAENKLPEIPIEIDIKISIPDVLDINNGDLRSKWGGYLHLTGSGEKTSMKGEVQLSKGYYILNGQEYQLKQGAISFGLDPEKNATIYTVCSRDINEYQVDIILQGNLSNPNIILRSNPVLPRQEILSLVLFGKSPSEISTFEDAQLEQSLSSLIKDTSTPGILSKIQKSIGIDRIDINRQEEEVSIKLGKYITKDLFIGLNKGFGEEPTRFSLEAKLRNDFKMQIDAGESMKGSADKASGQISLFWKKDY